VEGKNLVDSTKKYPSIRKKAIGRRYLGAPKVRGTVVTSSAFSEHLDIWTRFYYTFHVISAGAFIRTALTPRTPNGSSTFLTTRKPGRGRG
jgi:hypothetical protein